MKADYLSYRKATSVCLLGLGLQVVLGLTLLIYGLIATRQSGLVTIGDHAAVSGGLFILLGGVVWLVLAVLFDQHRRERIEHMETEALLASGARDSSAFSEQSGDELRVAAKRLSWMHRILVPGISVLFAAALALLGFWRFQQGRSILSEENFVSAPRIGVPIGMGLAIAFIGFTFARYVAGMAKQDVWKHLRAGAGAAAGAAVVGLFTCIAHFVDYVSINDLAKYLHVVIPGLMLVLASEVFFNFLGGLYTPRRAGEFPRPAFDSKILSFVAAPDRVAASIGEALNYQFGFDVTSNWFYQLLTRSLAVLLLTGVAVVWLLTGVAVVQPNEQGIRVRMGERVSDAPLGPGLYFKLPWPLEAIETANTTQVRRLNLGAATPKLAAGQKSILWTNDHGVEEVYFTVRPSADDRMAAVSGSAAPSDQRARDFALVNVEIPVYYVISDLVKFDRLGSPALRDDLLRAIGRRLAFSTMASYTIDDVVGGARPKIGAELRKLIEAEYAKLDAGVQVTFVGIEGVHPPRETANGFEQLVQAEQKRRGAIADAQKDANKAMIDVAGSVEMGQRIVAAIREVDALRAAKAPADKLAAKQREVQDLLIMAGGSAASAIQQARADRWTKHMSKRAQASAHSGRVAGFRAAPEVYLSQMYFDTLLESTAQARIYIVADDGKTNAVINLEDSSSLGNIFQAPKKEE
ncbi:MAG: hypothetical protein K2W85_00980 [Phycisphaerales bacterium]|nr:hypothetical protein [Phycisphaerales bacterium]